MEVQLKSNLSSKQPGHRITVTSKEIREYMLPRFKYFTNGAKFKKIRWVNKGLELYYKKFGDEVKVALLEQGGGYPETFYSINDLEAMLLPF